MESKWYFFPGQTPENTKISDRVHALHITEKAWGNITQHLDRKKRIQEAIDREEEHRRKLKEGSEAMTKQWKDSTENIRLRKEKERNERFGQKKEDKLEAFYKMREEQEAVRKEYTEKMKKKTFQSTGYPKELTSALILSETLHEREKQIEFDKMIKKREEEIERKFAEAVFENDEKERLQDKEEKKKKIEEEKKTAETLLAQIKEKRDFIDATSRSHIERETRDRIKAAEEEELLKQYEHEAKIKKIRKLRNEARKELEADRKLKLQLKKEDEEFEKAVEFYSKAKQRIECMKKQKEKEMQEEAINHRLGLAKKVAKEQENKEAIENGRVAKAIAEMDEAERTKHEQMKAMKEQAIQDRIEDRRQYLERLEKQKHIDEEMKKWEMLNRIKTAEVCEEYNEQKRKERWAQILEYRKELLEQMAEERQTRKEEKEMDELISKVSFEENDKMFFDYAKEVLKYAEDKNRTTYPIKKVIENYKKNNRLLPNERTRHNCQKHRP